MGVLIYFGINAFIILMWFILENYLIFKRIKNQKGVVDFKTISYEGLFLWMNVKRNSKFNYTFERNCYDDHEKIFGLVGISFVLMPVVILIEVGAVIFLYTSKLFKKVIFEQIESVEKSVKKSVDESSNHNKEHIEYSERLMDLTKK